VLTCTIRITDGDAELVPNAVYLIALAEAKKPPTFEAPLEVLKYNSVYWF
jgi:hypothetical protein